MRLAVFSDIHGNYHAFEAMLTDFEAAGDFDQVWCLGDLALGGTRPADCLTKLREMKDTHAEQFRVIGGNTDRYIVTGKNPEQAAAKDADALAKRIQRLKMNYDVTLWTLEQLTWADYEFLAKTIGRETATYVKGYGNLIGVHAIPGDDEPTSLSPDAPDEEAADALLDRQGRLALVGHTHTVMDRTVGNWRVINPGSVGFSFTQYGQAEWAIITIEDGNVDVDFRTVAYDVEAMVADASDAGHPHVEFMRSLLNRAKSE